MKTIIITFLISTILICSCQEDIDSVYEPDIVVESYLHEGDVIVVKLSQEIPFKLEEYDTIDFSKATVLIISSNSSALLDYNGEGLFIGDSLFTPQTGVIYTLEIELNNKIISSETIIPSKPQNFTISTTSIEIENSSSGGLPNMSETVDLYWDNPNGEYYLLQINNIESNPEAIYDEDKPSMPKKVMQEEGTKIRSMQFEYYGTHQIILHHINDELAAIYENQENSSQNLTNPTTNILNGYGIFTGINSDTLYLEVTD